MFNVSINRLKDKLAFLLSRKVDLQCRQENSNFSISDHRARISYDVSDLRRGLHYISIKYEAYPPLVGSRVAWEDDSSEEESEVFIFENCNEAEIFGTVTIRPGVRRLHFYPSRLESLMQVRSFTIRPITELAREWRYGIGFVQSKTFGYKWLLKKYRSDFIDRLIGGATRGLDKSYAAWWSAYGKCDAAILNEQHAQQSMLEYRPLISIVLPTYRPDLNLLRQAVESVFNQSYKNWQLCICDDASEDTQLTAYLKEIVAHDNRVVFNTRSNNGHISVATNDCIELADGDYIGFLDHDDTLAPNALYEYASELGKNRDLKLIYSDEDLVDVAGVPLNGHFKPDWNLDLARSINYICHFLVLESGILKEVGCLREGFEGAQDFDLLLRLYERLTPEEIKHIPLVLYHWRAAEGSTAASTDNKPYAAQAGVKALAEHLYRSQLSAVAEHSEIPTAYRVRYSLPEKPPSVSVIIPTKNSVRVLRNCISSLLSITDYPDFSVVIVDNDSDESSTLQYLSEIEGEEKIQVLPYPGPFNFAAINNYAVSKVTTDVVLLLNNDTEVLHAGWMAEMVSHALRPGVGAVGAKLLYANNRIQHAGVILGLGGDAIAGHAFKGRHKDEVGSLARTRLVQDYSAVTGACLAVLREKYLEVGGLDAENLKVAYNDIDFCLKLGKAGYRNIWTPYAQLYHYESYTRGPETLEENVTRYDEESSYMRLRWGQELKKDRNYNPNLSRGLRSFELAWPPFADDG